MEKSRKLRAVLVSAIAGAILCTPAIIRALDRRREAGKGGKEKPSIMDGEVKTGICSLDGTSLYVDYLGESGPTIFFVHGYLENGHAFHYQKPYFSGKYRVVSLDLPGFGRSGLPADGDYSPEKLSEALKAVARLMGALKPNRFSEAFSAYSANSSFMYLYTRWLCFGKRPPASQVELLQRSGSSASLEGMLGVPKERFRFEDDLPDVDIPVMLLIGSEDSLMAEDRQNRRTHALLPDSRLKVFEGAGHCALHEQPEEFNAALDGFLSECFG